LEPNILVFMRHAVCVA